jgi:hypothetical protein
VKLKLASCARPGNRAGFFHARGSTFAVLQHQQRAIAVRSVA